MIKGYNIPDEELVKLYARRVGIADKIFTKQREKDWGVLFRRYRLNYDPNLLTEDAQRVTVATGVSDIDAMFSSLVSVTPEIEVTNKGKGTRDQAYLAQLGILEVFEEQHVGDREGPATVKEALIIPIAWAKVDYEYSAQEVQVDRDPAEVASEIDALLSGAQAAGEQAPSPEQIQALVPLRETVRNVTVDRVVVDHVPWRNIRWDPSAKNVKDIRWMCQETRLPLEEVQNNQAFVDFVSANYGQRIGPAKLEKLKADAHSFKPDDIPDGKGTPDDELVSVYELHDLVAGLVCTWAKGADFFLSKRPIPFALNTDLWDRNCFVPLVLRSDPEEVEGVSDMALLAPVLDEETLYRSHFATYLSRNIPKVIVPKGALTPAGKKAFRSDEYLDAVEYDPQKGKPEGFTGGSLPQEIYDVYDKLKSEKDELTGTNELLRGAALTGRHSATETTYLAAASATRHAEKRLALENFYREIAWRILYLMQKNYDTERINRVSDMAGDVEWTWSDEDIAFRAGLDISLSPRQELSRQEREDSAFKVINFLGPLQFVSQPDLVQWALEEMGLPRSVISIFLKLPQEQQAQNVQDMANQAMAAQAAQGVAPTAAPTIVPGPFTGANIAALGRPGGAGPGVSGVAPTSEEQLAAMLGG